MHSNWTKVVTYTVAGFSLDVTTTANWFIYGHMPLDKWSIIAGNEALDKWNSSHKCKNCFPLGLQSLDPRGFTQPTSLQDQDRAANSAEWKSRKNPATSNKHSMSSPTNLNVCLNFIIIQKIPTQHLRLSNQNKTKTLLQ